MKDNMPKLKEVFKSNSQMEEFGLQCLMFHCMGYTAEDFKEYAEEMMADDDTREVIEAMIPAVEYALKTLKKEVNG